MPSQVVSSEITDGVGTYQILFQAEVSSLGSRVYQVAPASQASDLNTDLNAVTKSGSDYILENDKYKVTINSNGDISSIYDTTLSSLGRALEIQENLKVLYVLDAVFAVAAIVGAIIFFKFKKQEEN